jgi:phosphopantothenate synthetase
LLTYGGWSKITFFRKKSSNSSRTSIKKLEFAVHEINIVNRKKERKRKKKEKLKEEKKEKKQGKG